MADEYKFTPVDMQDLASGDLEVTVGLDGRVWINVDGLCRLRIARVSSVEITDPKHGYVKLDWHADGKLK